MSSGIFFSMLSNALRLESKTEPGGLAEALPGVGGGGPMSPDLILKRLVSVFINACRLLSSSPSQSQVGRGRLSLDAISFYVLSLLFGPCRLSEFTLAGPLALAHVNGDHVQPR